MLPMSKMERASVAGRDRSVLGVWLVTLTLLAPSQGYVFCVFLDVPFSTVSSFLAARAGQAIILVVAMLCTTRPFVSGLRTLN